MLQYSTLGPLLSKALFHDAVQSYYDTYSKKGTDIYQPCQWIQSDLLQLGLDGTKNTFFKYRGYT